MSRPAFLVEGDLEQKFIQNVCPTCPVQKINCNGDQTSLDAIAKRVGTLGRLLHKRNTPIVVVFDREGREETVEMLEKQFRDALSREAIDVPVIVGIPDRSIESWILADYRQFVLSAAIADDERVVPSEGKNGKSIIKKLIGAERKYVETIDGVAWLKAANPAVMKKHSASFAQLFCALGGIECWWLNRLEMPLEGN